MIKEERKGKRLRERNIGRKVIRQGKYLEIRKEGRKEGKEEMSYEMSNESVTKEGKKKV